MIVFVLQTRALTIVFVFFKQKTAYELRISDWSSDVCSSDLHDRPARFTTTTYHPPHAPCGRCRVHDRASLRRTAVVRTGTAARHARRFRVRPASPPAPFSALPGTRPVMVQTFTLSTDPDAVDWPRLADVMRRAPLSDREPADLARAFRTSSARSEETTSEP